MIRIVDVPDKPDCALCQVCLLPGDDLEAGRVSVRGRKMVMLFCPPIAEGYYCLEHGKKLFDEVKEHVDQEALKLAGLLDEQRRSLALANSQ